MSQGAIVRIDRQNYLAKNLGHVTNHVTRIYMVRTLRKFKKFKNKNFVCGSSINPGHVTSHVT
jgi:hypothetical protein